MSQQRNPKGKFLNVLNKNENTTYQNLWYPVKTVLRGNWWNLMHIRISPAFWKFALYYLWVLFLFYKRPILILVFTHLKKSKGNFCFYGKRWREEIALSICSAASWAIMEAAFTPSSESSVHCQAPSLWTTLIISAPSCHRFVLCHSTEALSQSILCVH